MMKKVIWGAGYTAAIFALSVGLDNIDCFVDSDYSKRGSFLGGKRVYHWRDITDYNGFMFYVPFNFYDEIYSILSRQGVERENIVKYYRESGISTIEARKDVKRKIEMISGSEGEILYFTSYWSFGQGYASYVKKIARECGCSLCLISELPWIDQSDCDIEMIAAPLIMNHRVFVYGKINKDEQLLTKDNRYEAIIGNEEALFNNMTKQRAEFVIFYIKMYLESLIKIKKPAFVIAHSSTFPAHRILELVCKDKGIPVLYIHRGILPGTISIEPHGMMGASLVSIYSDRFRTLPITKEEISEAEKIIEYVYNKNSKYQPDNKMIDCLEKESKEKTIVLFAGNLDELTRMVPYTDESRKYYSPVFKTSVEAGQFIEGICKKRGWVFVYKPHPSERHQEYDTLFGKDTYVFEQGNINKLVDYADIVVTISSSTSYISLMRGKPVVLLGYHIINGKGCAYEVYNKELIEKTMDEAVIKGCTKNQKGSFVKHIAQIVKYYLYDDMQERSIRYGKSMPKNVEELFFLETLAERN